MTDDPRRAGRKRLTGGGGQEQVEVKSATLQLFDVADAEAAIDAADVGKLAGKNPRWLAVQEKQRRADGMRERIRGLVADIEAEEATEAETPALKKSWLRARRLELMKALLKQPDEIIECEQLVGKVEQKLQEAKLQDGGKAKAAEEKKKKRKRKTTSSSESEEESGDDGDNEKADSDGGVDAGEDEDAAKDSKGGRRARKSGCKVAHATEDQPEEEDEEAQPRARVPGLAKKGKENRSSGLLRLRKLGKHASVDSTEEKADGCKSGDEKRSEAGGARKSNKDKAGKRAKDRQEDGERSESETEGAATMSKWKKPLKKMESIIRLPAKKKGVEKLPKGGVTGADRPDSGSGSDSGGSWGKRVQTREDLLAAESRRRLSHTSQEGAEEVANGNGIGRLSSASASDDDNDDEGGCRIVLEIDAGVSEVTAIRELPTEGGGKGGKGRSGGGGLLHRLKKRKEAAARKASDTAIEDIPVLQQQESVKQRLRERFAIKSRKPKRSASSEQQGAGEEAVVDSRTSSGDQVKKREKGKGKKGSSKDKDAARERSEAEAKVGSGGVDSEDSGGRDAPRGRGVGPSRSPPNGTLDHDDDTIHCISLDD